MSICDVARHAELRRTLNELLATIEKYGFKINDAKPLMRGFLARAKNQPDVCPFCDRKIRRVS